MLCCVKSARQETILQHICKPHTYPAPRAKVDDMGAIVVVVPVDWFSSTFDDALRLLVMSLLLLMMSLLLMIDCDISDLVVFLVSLKLSDRFRFVRMFLPIR